jgi:hypothetical protein
MTRPTELDPREEWVDVDDLPALTAQWSAEGWRVDSVENVGPTARVMLSYVGKVPVRLPNMTILVIALVVMLAFVAIGAVRGLWLSVPLPLFVALRLGWLIHTTRQARRQAG